MSLSIFSFEKPEKTVQPGGRATKPATQSGVVVAEPAEVIQRVIVDLDNLTPEALAAFFPSERTLKQAK